MSLLSINSINVALLGFLLLSTPVKPTERLHVATPQTANAPAFVGPRWQMATFTVTPAIDFDGDGKLDSDLSSFMPACDRDNALVFKQDGTITIGEGQLQCFRAHNRSQKNEAWQYNADDQTIVINHGHGDSTIWKVIETTLKVLTLETEVVEKGKPAKTTVTWNAQ